MTVDNRSCWQKLCSCFYPRHRQIYPVTPTMTAAPEEQREVDPIDMRVQSAAHISRRNKRLSADDVVSIRNVFKEG